jgi:histidinol dehydrogenase
MQEILLPELIDWRSLDESERALALARPAMAQSAERVDAVSRLIKQVRADGDASLKALTRRFDNVEIDSVRVPQSELDSAESELDAALVIAMRNAFERIKAFHEACAPKAATVITDTGVRCERHCIAMESVGLYVPAGTVPLPSTALMLGVPAMLAGCPSVALCCPPMRDGRVHAAVRFAAKLCGISNVFRVGGVQAIAAMAYGTETIPKCDKIFGPGNAYVTEAKLQVSVDPSGAAIDMPAGPSEVLVIADQDADAEIVASDLLSQAEHGADSQAVVVSNSAALLHATRQAVERQAIALCLVWKSSPNRIAFLQTALSASRYILVAEIPEALNVANRYASEHLILNVSNPRALLPAVRNAGSVFLGAMTPESVGDYNSGTNHVLPTYGYARAYSGVSVQSFIKLVTVQELSPAGLLKIGPETIAFANAEGLDAHANAVAIRLKKIDANAPNSDDLNATMALVRPEFAGFKGYSSARMEAKAGDRILLNANESPYLPFEGDTLALNRYPDPQPAEVIDKLAEIYRVQSNQVLMGRGSDEAIDLLTRAYCRAGFDAVLIMPPTFGMYKVCAQVQGARLIELPLRAENGFAPDFVAAKQALTQGVKLVYICTPNNPTGGLVDRTQVLDFIQAARGRAIVVVDEAYQEFANAESFTSELANYSNLVVLRTMSKAYALAGARVGVALAHADIIGLLRRLMAPYPVPKPVAAATLAALDNVELAHTRIKTLIAERERVRQALQATAGIEVYPSDANFLVFRCADAQAMYQALAERNVVVRDVSHYLHLANCLRVSIGLADENNRFLDGVRACTER